jgi:hypothetical protein
MLVCQHICTKGLSAKRILTTATRLADMCVVLSTTKDGRIEVKVQHYHDQAIGSLESSPKSTAKEALIDLQIRLARRLEAVSQLPDV